MTSYIKRLIDERQQVFNREHRSRKWKRLRNKISREIAKAKKEHYKTRVQRHKKANPAEWYKQIKVMANLNNSESTIQPPPGVDANDFEAVANSINNIFASVSNDLDVLDTAKLPAYRPDPNPCPTVHDYEVNEMLKKIKIGKAGGPDGISARLIREFSYELSKPLAEILNQSYLEGTVPPQWKRAVVVPIPKCKPATWDKLRPVSLTDHFAKVAEGFMAKWLLEDLERSIDPNQYGNRKGVSTTHYLVKLMDTLIMNSDKPGHLSSVVITDFSKAFDLVNHNVLINKFISLGIRPSVVTWIASFLDGREQSVRYRGQNSDWVKLKGGVPQGTRIGPLGFVTVVNDAAMDSSVTTLKYVDDLTLVETRARNDASNMQIHLDKFQDWAVQNHMKLNPLKCASMKVSFLRNNPVEQPLMIDNVPLQSVSAAKILGVHVSSDLKWGNHVTEVLKKANCRLYMLKLLKRFNLPTDDLITIFSGFVRPLAEYAAPVWHPGLTIDESAALERIQKRACRIIVGKQYTTYDEALELCKLPTMYERREQQSLKFFNSLFKSERFNSWVPPKKSTIHGRVLRNSDQLAVPRCRTLRCQKSPLVYMANMWNKKDS